MSITVGTGALVQMLTDALETASSNVGGIHLATFRAPWKDEPGDRDLLAATSTTKRVMGHTWIPVDGQNLTPTVWPIYSAVMALSLCKSLSKKGENHTVDLRVDLAPPPENPKKDEHPGWIVTVSETSALFDSDTALEFHALHESRFPVDGVARLLAGEVRKAEDDDKVYVDEPLTLWPTGVMGPLVKVAKRRGGTIRMYRSQEHRLQLVQIGPTWIGAAHPADPLPGEPKDGPDVDPVLTPASA